MDRTWDRFIKQKSSRFFILGGVLINCVNEQEAKKLIDEFHAGECEGHHYWKDTMNKITREVFYWPTIFFDTHKEIVVCHKCHIFEGKRTLFPFPLKPIHVEAPF